MNTVLPAGCLACIAIRLLKGEVGLGQVEDGLYPVGCFKERGMTDRAVHIRRGGLAFLPPTERQISMSLAEIHSVPLDNTGLPRAGVQVISYDCTSGNALTAGESGMCAAGVVPADGGGGETLEKIRRYWNT